MAGGSGAIFQTEGRLCLNDIRKDLITLEQTIIFALTERARFKRNTAIYVRDSPLCANLGDLSFMEFMLQEMEKVHALMRRYQSPDEFPFFPHALPPPLLPPMRFPAITMPHKMNFNNKVLSIYLERVLPMICADGDDGNYGSAANCDIVVLQAISKRIHYGMYVAEVKFNEDQALYERLIRARDLEGIMATLTNAAVEARLLQRLKVKAATYGREITDESIAAADSSPPIYNIDPEVPVRIYADYLIPLTKEVELEYLIRRLEPLRVSYTGAGGRAAADASLPGCTLLERSCVPEVFGDVLCNKATFGVVPYCSATCGIVRDTQDALFTTETQVCGDVFAEENESGAKTRFLVVGGSQKHPRAARSGSDVTFCVMGTPDEPGSLSTALTTLSKHAVNLVSIESSTRGPGASFLVELEGHADDPHVSAAIGELSQHTTFVRVLGSLQKRKR